MSDQKYEVGKTYRLDISLLEENPEQVRHHFDESSLKALAEDIGRNGLLQNICFTLKDNKRVIVAGERRWRAAKLANQDEIDGKYVEGDIFELALVENIFREDLTAVEYSESVRQLKERKQFKTNLDLGNYLGLKESSVSEILKIVELPTEMLDRVRDKPGITRKDLLTVARVRGEKRKNDAFEKLLASHQNENQENTPNKSDKTLRPSKLGKRILAIQTLQQKYEKFDMAIFNKATEEEKVQFADEVEKLVKELRKIVKKVKPSSPETSLPEGAPE